MGIILYVGRSILFFFFFLKGESNTECGRRDFAL